MKNLIGLFWLALISSVFAQSTNLRTSLTNLNVADFQTRAERDLPLGYPSLDASSLVLPWTVFPGFNAAPAGSFWVKSGSAMAIQPGVAFSPDTVTVDNVTIGEFSAGQRGITTLPNYPLILTSGGVGNPNVYIGYNKTLGGGNATYTTHTWSIGPSGNFVFGGGSFTGVLDFNNSNLTEIGVASGSGVSFNFNSGAVTSPGSVSFGGVTGGVIVPNTGTLSNNTHALNTITAGAMFAETLSPNTFADTQTFSVAPVFPSASIPQDRISGLPAELLSLLKLDGTRPMTGNLNAGSNRIINVAAPTADGDAINRLYLQSTITSDTVNSLTATAPLAVSPASPAQGDITISIPEANSGTNGFLSSAKFNEFDNKQGALTAQLPLFLDVNQIGINTANTSTTGALTAADWNRFDDVITNLQDGYIWRGSGGGLEAVPYSPANTFLGGITASIPPSVPYASNNSTPGLLVFFYTIPANSLAVGSVIKITVIGRYGFSGNSGTPLGSESYLQAAIGIEGNPIAISLANSPVALYGQETFGNPVFVLEWTMTFRSIGPSASGAAVGKFELINRDLPIASISKPYSRADAFFAVPTSPAVNTQVDNTFSVRLRNAKSNALDQFQVDQAFITVN